MRLFHTSDRIIREPDLTMGRRNADFGHGFYLAADEEFAGSWARERTSSAIVVNEYELDTDGLSIWSFRKDAEWLEYILRNRRGSEDIHADRDVIMGPIASDTLFETYGIITSGLLTQEQALELLAIGPDYTQVAIRSERAAMQLVWKGSYTLDEAAMETARMNYDAAKESFDSEFGAALDRMNIE